VNTANEEFNELKKLGLSYRALASILFIASAFAAIISFAVLFSVGISLLFLVIMLFSGLVTHISGSVLFTGFAPSYLLFAHGKVNLKRP